MIYVTGDGQRYQAETAEELVSQMRQSAFLAFDSDAAFMEHSAARAMIQFEKEVRCDTAVNYVEDLIRIGLLKQEDEKQEDEKDEV